MKHLNVAVVLAISLLAVAPVLASPLTERGVTREEMVDIMKANGLPAKIDKDSKGNVIVKSRTADINFDVYFFRCAKDSCREIQFAAGWSNSSANQARINEWNTTKRFLRVYSKPGKVIWAEQDAIVSNGTTENIDEYLTLLPTIFSEFKKFMNL